MNACKLTASITAIANWLACQLSQAELELLGVPLTQLGDTLLTITTQECLLQISNAPLTDWVKGDLF